MIVVDTNVIAALVLPTSQHTREAERLLQRDHEWVAPVLWRSEFTNILVTGTRNEWFTFEQALEALAAAEALMDGGEYHVPASDVLQLATAMGCTGYDSVFRRCALCGDHAPWHPVQFRRQKLGSFRHGCFRRQR